MNIAVDGCSYQVLLFREIKEKKKEKRQLTLWIKVTEHNGSISILYFHFCFLTTDSKLLEQNVYEKVLILPRLTSGKHISCVQSQKGVRGLFRYGTTACCVYKTFKCVTTACNKGPAHFHWALCYNIQKSEAKQTYAIISNCLGLLLHTWTELHALELCVEHRMINQCVSKCHKECDCLVPPSCSLEVYDEHCTICLCLIVKQIEWQVTGPKLAMVCIPIS